MSSEAEPRDKSKAPEPKMHWLADYMPEIDVIERLGQKARELFAANVRQALLSGVKPDLVPQNVFEWMQAHQDAILPATEAEETGYHYCDVRTNGENAMLMSSGNGTVFLHRVTPEMFLTREALMDFNRSEAFGWKLTVIERNYFGYTPTALDLQFEPEYKTTPANPDKAREILNAILVEFPLPPEV